MQFLQFSELRPEILKVKLKANAKALTTAPFVLKSMLLQERNILKRHLKQKQEKK